MTGASELGRPRRIGDIEVLRAFAVAGVVIKHTADNFSAVSMTDPRGWREWLNPGNGVQLFFVISGFVVARSLVHRLTVGDRRAKLVEAWNFLVARFWRLTPSAWLWLGIVMAFSVLFNHTNAFRTPSSNLGATLAGVLDYANIRFARSFMIGDYGASYQYWTLSLEEQFYLLLPIGLLLAGRYFLLLAAIFAVGYLAVPVTTVIVSVTDLGNLALGVCLAFWVARRGRRPPWVLVRKWWVCSVLIVGLLVAICVVGSPKLPLWHHWIAATGLLSAVAVWTASFDKDLIGPTRIRGILIWIGSRSYALYLAHLTMIDLAQEASWRFWGTAPPPLVGSLFVVIMSTVAADLNYRLVECKLRATVGHLGRVPQPAA